MAKKFAAEGARVVITGRSAEQIEAAKEEIEQAGGQVLYAEMDMRATEKVQLPGRGPFYQQLERRGQHRAQRNLVLHSGHRKGMDP